jgi:hypothetical protein
MPPILFLHIAGGLLAVTAGYAALSAPKGKWMHRRPDSERCAVSTRTDLALTGFAVALAITSLMLTVKYTITPTAESLKIPLPLALLTPAMARRR